MHQGVRAPAVARGLQVRDAARVAAPSVARDSGSPGAATRAIQVGVTRIAAAHLTRGA